MEGEKIKLLDVHLVKGEPSEITADGIQGLIHKNKITEKMLAFVVTVLTTTLVGYFIEEKLM
jgi:hypothetical protein